MKERQTPLQRLGEINYSSDTEIDGYRSPSKSRLTYADFLLEQERLYGPNGAIDSEKVGHSVRPGSLNRTPKRSRSVGSLVDVYNAEKDLQSERESRLRVIEAQIAESRSQKRDLRRQEGSYWKRQNVVKKKFEKFESAIQRRMDRQDNEVRNQFLAEDKKKQEYLHQKKNMNADKKQYEKERRQSLTQINRKFSMTLSNLERRYRSKLSEFQLKQIEIDRLTKEFTQKLKIKEEEEFKIKKELADLSLALIMELKKKSSLDEDNEKDFAKDRRRRLQKEREVDSDYEDSNKAAAKARRQIEHSKQKYTIDLEKSQKETSEKLRRSGRKILDTRNRTQYTRDHLLELQRSLEDTNTAIKSDAIRNRIQAVSTRKTTLSVDSALQHKLKADQELEGALERAWHVNIDQRRSIYHDVSSQYNKQVSYRTEKEKQLHHDVKALGLSRNNQQKIVSRIQKELTKVKAQNERQMQKQLNEHKQKELEIERRLLLEEGRLQKEHTSREEKYQSLLREREILRNDKWVLDDIEKEQRRLKKVGEISDMAYSSG